LKSTFFDGRFGHTVSRNRRSRATSEILAPSLKLSATIRASSSAVHRRCRCSPVINSIRRYEPRSCLASCMASAIHSQLSTHARLYRRPSSPPRGGGLVPVTHGLHPRCLCCLRGKSRSRSRTPLIPERFLSRLASFYCDATCVCFGAARNPPLAKRRP
jgi:hypothetical protein